MARRYSKSAVDMVTTISELFRASIKSIIKDAMIEALEEVDHQSVETESNSSRSRSIILLTTLFIVIGVVLLRRRTTESSQVLDQVSKRRETEPSEPAEQESETDEEDDQQIEASASD